MSLTTSSLALEIVYSSDIRTHCKGKVQDVEEIEKPNGDERRGKKRTKPIETSEGSRSRAPLRTTSPFSLFFFLTHSGFSAILLLLENDSPKKKELRAGEIREPVHGIDVDDDQVTSYSVLDALRQR